jgi:hypothetical protein
MRCFEQATAPESDTLSDMKQVVICSLLAVACAGCVAPMMRSTLSAPPTPVQSAELWQAPTDIATRNLFDGPWGKDLAPDPTATFSFVSAKTAGISPGYTVTDAKGLEWSVKQGPEAKVEVVMSRLLSAVGYHQPPVYYLPKWTLAEGYSKKTEPEARFRPKHSVLKDEGEWSWHENPFIGTQPYNGLRVLLMILNGSDLKDSNNTLYSVNQPADSSDAPRRWFVVRDIGAALGETGRLNPGRGDPELFEENRFITGVKNGVVEFEYRGRHQELADHISVDDVKWMCNLLTKLSDEQWHDAFRAAGYNLTTSDRFITRIKTKIAEGLAL